MLKSIEYNISLLLTDPIIKNKCEKLKLRQGQIFESASAVEIADKSLSEPRTT